MSPRRCQCNHNWPKFWWEEKSVTRICLRFGHTDVFSHPNCGHPDISWPTCIMRISASKANLKLKKKHLLHFYTIFLAQGFWSLILFLFWPLLSPFKWYFPKKTVKYCLLRGTRVVSVFPLASTNVRTELKSIGIQGYSVYYSTSADSWSFF